MIILQFAPRSHLYPMLIVPPCRTTIHFIVGISSRVLMLATTVKRATQVERGRADGIGACGGRTASCGQRGELSIACGDAGLLVITCGGHTLSVGAHAEN